MSGSKGTSDASSFDPRIGAPPATPGLQEVLRGLCGAGVVLGEAVPQLGPRPKRDGWRRNLTYQSALQMKSLYALSKNEAVNGFQNQKKENKANSCCWQNSSAQARSHGHGNRLYLALPARLSFDKHVRMAYIALACQNQPLINVIGVFAVRNFMAV